VLLFLAFSLRPRLVIYNTTVEQLRPILAEVVSGLDTDARWAGESLVLPHQGIQLHIEPLVAMRNVQLVSSGPRQDYAGWRRLEAALGSALRHASSPPNPYGFSLILFGLLMVALVTFSVVQDTQSVAQSLEEMLRQ
jgi:hypothetical protein